jgi:hypothetical protein
MSRSYHITRKAADKAMDEGDLEPTWQASEKRDVKEAITRGRQVARSVAALTGRTLTSAPNRAYVSKEKGRTAAAQERSRDLDEKLQGTLKENGKDEN